MAVVQSKNVTLDSTSTTLDAAFDASTSAQNTLFAAVIFFTDAEDPVVTPPSGWTLLDRFHANGFQWCYLYSRSGDGTQTSFSVEFSDLVHPSVTLWEDDDIGEQVDLIAGNGSDTQVGELFHVTSNPITVSVGDRLFAIHWSGAAQQTWQSEDPSWTTVHGPVGMLVLTKDAASTTETSTASRDSGGWSGWMLVAFTPAAGGGDPGVEEVTGSGSVGVEATGTIVAIAPGTYGLDVSGFDNFEPPVGAFLRLIGTTTADACWVEVVQVDGTMLYVVDAEQPGDDTLATVYAGNEAVEVRYHTDPE